MKYVGRTKVGKVKTNPTTELAIIRLPVEMKEKAGKFAHIWKVDEDTILIRFSESKEVEGLPSVYFGVHQVVGYNVEERLSRLEEIVAGIVGEDVRNAEKKKLEHTEKVSHGRDLNPRPRAYQARALPAELPWLNLSPSDLEKMGAK